MGRVKTKNEMSEYAFYKIDDEVLAELELPDVPFPVRKETEQAVFGGDKIDFQLLLKESDDYLAQHPEYTDRYRYTIAFLCYIIGIDAGSEGEHLQAQQYFEKGLTYMPQNTSLRANYALALQAQGKKDEALGQYRQILNDADIESSPLLWSLAARLSAEQGDYQDAQRLLNEIAPFFSEDEKGFWETKEKIETKIENGGTEEHPKPVVAGAKDASRGEDEWFYLADGKPVGPVSTDELKNKLSEGLLARDTLVWKEGIGDWRAADNAGLIAASMEKVEKPPQNTRKPVNRFCTKCGAGIKEGVKFCTRCGAPVKE